MKCLVKKCASPDVAFLAAEETLAFADSVWEDPVRFAAEDAGSVLAFSHGGEVTGF